MRAEFGDGYTSEAAHQTVENCRRSVASHSVGFAPLRGADITKKARRGNLLHSVRCWPLEMSDSRACLLL